MTEAAPSRFRIDGQWCVLEGWAVTVLGLKQGGGKSLEDARRSRHSRM